MENSKYFMPDEIIQNNIKSSISKTQFPKRRLFFLGILAGVFIACGAMSSNVAMHNISNISIARFVGGIIFPLGLIMIVFIGGELFTGDCLMIMGLIDKKYSLRKTLKVLLIVYISNFIGAFIMAFLVYYSGQFNFSSDLLGAYTINIALTKSSTNFISAFCSGILCNIFVCAAVIMASAAKDVVGKIITIFFPILAFVVCGFEHCVANMYYISAGLLALNNADYVNKAIEEYNYNSEQLDTLNISNFILNNAIPVTLGNVVGGMIFVGVVYYYTFNKTLSKISK